MPRPSKCRKVCQMPAIQTFRPERDPSGKAEVILTVDEYEAIRLIDKQGLSQETCSSYMHIARTTVQMIYNSARKKLAEALVDGLTLRIEGGNYRLCDGEEAYCDCGGCRKHRRKQRMMSGEEEGKMRIAIPLDENRQDVCIVLARAPWFLLQEGDRQTILENPAAQAQGGAGIQMAQFLLDNDVDILITVRCGQNAADVFTAAGMKIYQSAGRTAAEDLAALAEGKLKELTQFHGGFHGIQ